MLIKELKERLEATGLPVAYSHFADQTDPPFIAYLLPESRNIAADDSVYQTKMLVQVELYTNIRDLELEKKVEQQLTDVIWKKTTEYIESEAMFETIYEMEVMTE